MLWNTVLVKFEPSLHNFIKLGPQHEYFPENFPKFSEQLFLRNTPGQLFLNLHTISIVPTPFCHTGAWEHEKGGWRNSQS